MLIVTHNDLTTLTATLYGEVRGCSKAQRENVARVIVNRYNAGWDSSVKAVCLAPYQFSCWLHNDPNYQKILNAPEADPEIWAELLDIATMALTDKGPDRVMDADSYYAVSMKVAPNWARAPARMITRDDAHIFWRVRRS